VKDNRALYRAKFDVVVSILENALDVRKPQASFYLWVSTPGSDITFTQELYARTRVTVLSGSFLAREAHGSNPGNRRIRIALVAPMEKCIEAAQRIAQFVRTSV
jgi:N-succinyldiaminopimelate aminotransferase